MKRMTYKLLWEVDEEGDITVDGTDGDCKGYIGTKTLDKMFLASLAKQNAMTVADMRRGNR